MRSLTVAVGLFVLALIAFAQSDRGTITGTISDPAGAVVANAAIEARNQATGVVYPAASTATGNYTILQLPVGTYEVSVAVPGFKKYVRRGITVEVAQTLRIDIPLEVGGSTESVTVQADAPLLRTESGDISHTVNASTMDDLPILGIGAGQAGSAGKGWHFCPVPCQALEIVLARGEVRFNRMSRHARQNVVIAHL
jgi:hypothetical protein